jgi:crotonobetainyl-CoA:carnitine CoA-transferase CaiB-like acyl-CoA transferase
MERLRSAGVPCTPMNTIAEAVASPQTAALGQQIRHVAGSELTLSALPLSFEGRRPSPSSLAPKLGEHNAALLGRSTS